MIKLTSSRSILLLICLIPFIGCAPVVKIQLNEARTSLENQVLGTYKQIGQEAWMISSVRGAGSGTVKLSPNKKEVFAAIENQEFNADDIAEFKDEGLIGENSLAELVIRQGLDGIKSERLELVKQVIAEENHDRLVIIRRIIIENPQLKLKDLDAVRQAFARIYWREAKPNHWLINMTGQWLLKKQTSGPG